MSQQPYQYEQVEIDDSNARKKSDKIFIVENYKIYILDYSERKIVYKVLTCVNNALVISSQIENNEPLILVGTKEGEILMINYEDDKILSKNSLNTKNERKLLSLYWFHKNYAIVYDYIPVKNSNPFGPLIDEEPRFVILYLTDDGVLKRISTYFCSNYKPINNNTVKVYNRYLKEWNILLCGCSNNLQVFFRNEEIDVWKKLKLTNDQLFIPMGETFVLDIDLCLNQSITEKSYPSVIYPASPLIHLLTNSGKLQLYSLINTNYTKPYPEIENSLHTLESVTKFNEIKTDSNLFTFGNNNLTTKLLNFPSSFPTTTSMTTTQFNSGFNFGKRNEEKAISFDQSAFRVPERPSFFSNSNNTQPMFSSTLFSTSSTNNSKPFGSIETIKTSTTFNSRDIHPPTNKVISSV
ncbi:hypothetical protein ABK040_003619 [Willaertia magna]